MDYRDASEADLSRACRQGQAAAWREVVRRFTPLVYRITLRMLRQPQEAEDATQEAFVRMHGSFESFDPTRPLTPWVSRVAYNVGLRRLERSSQQRKIADQAALEPELVGEDPETPEQVSHGREAATLLNNALEELAVQDRALITLRYHEGLSNAEVAEATEMSVSTVRVRLFRARSLLKRVLAPLLEEAGA